MKKVSLLMLVAMFLFVGNLRAQDVEVLIEDNFEAYTVGNKIALEGAAAGNDWWTTWGQVPGGSEDGIVAEYDGSKCGYLTYGNDQVLKLGGTSSGVYDLEFDILIPNGKNGYFNILHEFDGMSSTWALESHLHMSSATAQSPGAGAVEAGGEKATIVCIYDDWMHFRLHVDTDADLAQYYYTLPGEEEELVLEWQWSLDSQGNPASRKLDAMNFFPPLNVATSEYYLDNFKCTRIGGETASELTFNPEAIEEEVPADDMASVAINIENNGTSIGEYSAWVDYGVGQGGNEEQVISYAIDPVSSPAGLTWQSEQPVNFEVASLFPATAYGNSVMGTYITGAAYAFFEWQDQSGNQTADLEPGTDIIFRIYGPGTNGKPGEVLAEKTITRDQIVWNQYTLVEFDEPVALTGFDVYVGVEMTAAVSGTTMSLDGSSQAVVGFGDLYRQGKGAFLSITENGGGQNYGNWCLFMLCQGAPVVGGYATLDKTSGSLAIGGSDQVNVNLSTIGLTPNQTYEAAVKFVTNDPAQPTVNIPLTLKVGGENIAENVVETYNVYPNPTTGAVTVEGENIDYIAVYNSVGQLVNVVKNVNNTVDMSSYENGVYFFNIVDNAGQSALQRIVVAK
ncbi:MAG: T9SS type A sorting domain-containing protein [Bacteroidales bacterium]|nr:T9SS type A sorting domain-containing protein [Bacteroidales bacterium]